MSSCPWCYEDISLDDIDASLFVIETEEVMSCPHCGRRIFGIWEDDEEFPHFCKQ